jgi:hypothetical protein
MQVQVLSGAHIGGNLSNSITRKVMGGGMHVFKCPICKLPLFLPITLNEVARIRTRESMVKKVLHAQHEVSITLERLKRLKDDDDEREPKISLAA